MSLDLAVLVTRAARAGRRYMTGGRIRGRRRKRRAAVWRRKLMMAKGTSQVYAVRSCMVFHSPGHSCRWRCAKRHETCEGLYPGASDEGGTLDRKQ